MTVLMGSSLKTSIRYLPRFSDLTSPAFSKTSMCLAIACREMATLCRMIFETCPYPFGARQAFGWVVEQLQRAEATINE